MKNLNTIKEQFSNYPENYYDFTDGKNCENKQINEWIRICLESIKVKISEGKFNPSHNISSGNTLVSVNSYIQDNGKYTIISNVSKSYSEISEYDIEL